MNIILFMFFREEPPEEEEIRDSPESPDPVPPGQERSADDSEGQGQDERQGQAGEDEVMDMESGPQHVSNTVVVETARPQTTPRANRYGTCT